MQQLQRGIYNQSYLCCPLKHKQLKKSYVNRALNVYYLAKTGNYWAVKNKKEKEKWPALFHYTSGRFVNIHICMYVNVCSFEVREKENNKKTRNQNIWKKQIKKLLTTRLHSVNYAQLNISKVKRQTLNASG